MLSHSDPSLFSLYDITDPRDRKVSNLHNAASAAHARSKGKWKSAPLVERAFRRRE